MEYELFRSKLKPSVDGALISSIIRSSSSGLSSHRTGVMELIIERSIRERRERTFTKAKNSLQPEPIPQAKRTSEAPNTSIPEVQLPAPAPAPAPQLPSQSLPNDTTGIVTSPPSASAKCNASLDSPVLSKRAKEIKVARGEEPPADVKTNPSPSEDSVELACHGCGVRQLRSRLWGGIYCAQCPAGFDRVKCVGCGTIRVDDFDACTGCHHKFK